MKRAKKKLPPAPPPGPNPARTLLFTVPGSRDGVQRLVAEVTRLETLYQRKFQRKLAVELFVSSWGQPPHSRIGLTAHYLPGEERALAFLRENLDPLFLQEPRRNAA